jgi:hypothetical protein
MKEIIIKINNALGTIPSIWKVVLHSVAKNLFVFIVLASSLSAALVFVLKKDGTMYTGHTRFILLEKSGRNMAGMDGILGSFGFGGDQKENFERLVDFVKTQRIQQDILMSPYVTKSETTTVGDALVASYNLEEELESLDLKDFSFAEQEKSASSAKFKRASARLGKIIAGTDDIEGLVDIDYDRKSFIIKIAAGTQDEDLTIGLLNATYASLEKFYCQDMSPGQEKDLNLLHEKKDSLDRDIRRKELKLAKLKDKTKGLILNQDKIEEGRLFMQIQLNYELLGELTKNEALAEYSFVTSDRGFLLLDEPIKPLYYGSRALWKVITFSVLASLFIAVFVVFSIAIFKKPEILDFES